MFAVKHTHCVNTIINCMFRKALPIRCLDGFILGAYLSHDIPNCKRFPLRFMSKMPTIATGSNTTETESNISNESTQARAQTQNASIKNYWHIVLGTIYQTRINNSNKFGSIGISRVNTLGYKPCIYDNLLDLIIDFFDAYSKIGHKVTKITIGLPLTNDIHSDDPIYWDILHLNVNNQIIKKKSNINNCPSNINSVYDTLLQITNSFFNQSENIRQCMLDNKEPKSKIHSQIVWNCQQSHFCWIPQN